MTQEEALTILKTGANVFITGEPRSDKKATASPLVLVFNTNDPKGHQSEVC